MALEMAKGVRDFPPQEKIIRQELVNKLTVIFENYGFSPLETPLIERLDTLTAKYAAGESSDAAKEIFKIIDQGERKLGLRFDLTVPFSRFIAMNPNVKMPFKRYEVGRVYRDGPIKLGRYREFWQCDVDVVGCKKMTADAEIINLALDVFKALKLDAYIEFNNRKILFGMLKEADVDEKDFEAAIIIIDKLKKIGISGVKKEIHDLKIKKASIDKIEEILSFEGTNEKVIEFLEKTLTNDEGKDGVKELKETYDLIEENNKKNVKIHISLARGLAYYTGTIFEGFFRKSEITSSICGGGRYDKLIGQLMGSKLEFPAVGISFGLEPITENLKLKNANIKKSVVDLYIVPIKAMKESFELIHQIRNAGINCDIDLVGRGVSKNFDFANSYGIPYVMVVGENELKDNLFTLKDMTSGKEEKLTVEQIIKKLKK